MQKYPVRVDHAAKEGPLLAATGSCKPFRHPIVIQSDQEF